MFDHFSEKIDDQWIISRRGNKNQVDLFVPYAFHVEKEYTHRHVVEEVATIFLTNRECPFHCLMCDLWKNTTDDQVPVGAIPEQINFALQELPKTKHLKLYNSGNFFDTKAIPVEDYRNISDLIVDFETVIIENHPRLVNQRCLDFSRQIHPELQVAMGLETVHPKILPLLNKQMTLDDFEKAVQLLKSNQILTRTFILLGLPFLSEKESVEWAKRSIDFAFETGVECCAIIPTRSGNGAMDYFQKNGDFKEPTIDSIFEVMEYGLNLNAGRVLADLWDLERFSNGMNDFSDLKNKLERMNLEQRIVG